MKNLFFTFLCILIFSCCADRDRVEKSMSREDLKESLIEANKNMALKESKRIDHYIKKRKWEVSQTGTGLRYFIYKKDPEGLRAEKGKYALVEYEISLLDGTVCYTSKDKGPRKFLIGRDHVENGLHEGITYMRVGEKAKFILPSHLGHGLTGDLHKIPLRSTLVFDVELLSLD